MRRFMLELMIMRIALVLLLATCAVAAQKKAPAVKPWKALDGGLTVKTRSAIYRTTLGREVLLEMVRHVEAVTPFYRKHFKHKLKNGWTFVVLRDFGEYNAHATDATNGRRNVQGQCFQDRKIITVCNHRRYGWKTTLSHEYAHAHYPCQGPIWIREGIASLAEVAEKQGQKWTIPVNPPRLRGLKRYQRSNHYLTIDRLVRGEKEADGYGYSYEHGWSIHYFLYKLDAAKYRKFIRLVRKKRGPDLTEDLKKVFAMKVETLNARWKDFVEELEAPAR